MKLKSEELIFNRENGEKEAIINTTNGTLVQLELSGITIGGFEVIVSGQVSTNGNFYEVAAINNKNFAISKGTITSFGIYQVDVSGFQKLKLLFKPQDETELSCTALVVNA